MTFAHSIFDDRGKDVLVSSGSFLFFCKKKKKNLNLNGKEVNRTCQLLELDESRVAKCKHSNDLPGTSQMSSSPHIRLGLRSLVFVAVFKVPGRDLLEYECCLASHTFGRELKLFFCKAEGSRPFEECASSFCFRWDESNLRSMSHW